MPTKPTTPGDGQAGRCLSVSVVPEPSTVAMSFSGALLLMGFVGWTRRGNRAAALARVWWQFQGEEQDG